MQFLWIGNLEEDTEYNRKIALGYSNSSAQIAQKNLILGIESNTKSFVDSINGSAVQKYPVYSEKIITRICWSRANDFSKNFNVSVSFKNQGYFNRIYCRKSMIKEAANWMRTRYQHNDKLVVFVYSLRSSSLGTAAFIKKNIPSAKIVLIVTDLPKYMDLSENLLKRFLKKIDGFYINNYRSKVDRYVLYAPKMAKYLKLTQDQWICMEGCFVPPTKDNRCLPSSSQKTDLFKFAYCGKLEKKYGIELLLKAFSLIRDRRIRLFISGEGKYSKKISEYCKNDSRIIFYGFLKDRDSVLRLQSHSDCLINLRLASEKNSLYSFPSKLFEYIYSGKPVISFELSSIPSEYYQRMFMVEHETVSGLRDIMIKVMNTDKNQLELMGASNRQFILDEKNNVVQTKKILDFIS